MTAGTPAEAPAELTLTEKLARFLHDAYLDAGAQGLAEINTPTPWDQLDAGMQDVSRHIATAVIEGFLRVDGEARNLYAISGVDADTLTAYGAVHWGALFGRMTTDELRGVGAAFVEVAEQAELEAAMARWLYRDSAGTAESEEARRSRVADIIRSFRMFRAELDGTEPAPVEAAQEPGE